MSKISLPIHVILATIRNSPSGKFVIVEGVDDIIIYRILITLYKSLGIQVIPAGGRDKVLEIFDEIKLTDHINKTIFIVDKDLWVFTGIPTEYQHERIITTSGYSIENDIFIDKDVMSLLKATATESKFNDELLQYLRWFSLAVTRFINNSGGEILDIHPQQFFKNIETTTELCNMRVGESFPQSLYDDLLTNYSLKFRGKCLLHLGIRALNSRPSSPRYNHATIMEETAINQKGIHLNRIFSTVGTLAASS